MVIFEEKAVIDTLTNGKIYRIAPKCGTIRAGGVAVWGTKNWQSKTFFYVVSQAAYYKFMSFQMAACYGKEGVDFFIYKTAKVATKKANVLLALLQTPNV